MLFKFDSRMPTTETWILELCTWCVTNSYLRVSAWDSGFRISTGVVEQVKLADDVSSFKAYPVLRVGVSYRF